MKRINDVIINEYERVDDLQRNSLQLIQDPKAFCFGVDAVLLSRFVSIKKGDNVIDLGCGNGIIPILLSGSDAAHITGIDIQDKSVDLALRNVLLNSLSDKIEIFKMDIKNCHEQLKKASFNVVVSNPPYMNEDGGMKNESDELRIARHEILLKFSDIAYAASKLLKFGGRFYLIHKPTRLVELFATLSHYKLEPKTIRFVHPKSDKDPTMVLIESVLGGNSYLNVKKPLVIYEQTGEYTKELKEIYCI